MAALSVFLSAAAEDAAFAERLRQAIIAAGGAIVSEPPSAVPRTDVVPLSDRELATLRGARAFVTVLTPTAFASARMRDEAQHAAEAPRDGKRILVPVHLDPIAPEAAWPALRGVSPVTGPYGEPRLQEILIAETLRRLGLPVRRNWALLAVLALLLLLLVCCLVAGLVPGPRAVLIGFWPGAARQAATVTPTATPTPTAIPPGTGLLGQYYRSRTAACCAPMTDDLFGTLLFTRVDPQININSVFGQYPDPRLAGDAYAIRWTGTIRSRYTETYTFVTHSDDGVRVWVDGRLLIDNWTTHAEQADTGTIALTAGRPYDIKVEYYENNVSGAVITLQWQSASQSLELVPQSQLYPPA